MDNKDVGQELIEQIVIFLKEEGFQAELFNHKIGCWFTYIHSSVHYQCHITVRYDLSMLVFHFTPPIIIDDEFLVPIAEFVTRANYKANFGNFELDFSENKIRYTKIMQWQKAPVQMQEIKNTLYSGVSMWGMFYLQLVRAIIYRNFSPEEVMRLK